MALPVLKEGLGDNFAMLLDDSLKIRHFITAVRQLIEQIQLDNVLVFDVYKRLVIKQLIQRRFLEQRQAQNL